MDAETFPQEILADEEPKYLRRQKPLEIKRRKFGRKTWHSFLRITIWTGAGLACAWSAYAGARFLLFAPEMRLIHPEQVSVSGNHFVTRASILQLFALDRGKSILRISLAERRAQLEAIPWVDRATVRRVLPNRIQVDIVERTPVAFLREGNDMELIDAKGTILDRPLRADFRFPVLTGIFSGMPRDERQKRMQLFESFAQQVEEARPGAMTQVSEIDLTDADDLTASITGLQRQTSAGGAPQSDVPVLVHFGNADFGGKYTTLADNIDQWRATAGPVDSVDLRFGREAVVNPEIAQVSQIPAESLQPAFPARAAGGHRVAPATARARRQHKVRRHSR